MINLLPPKEKNNLQLEWIKNLIVVLGGDLIVFLISLSLVFLSIKFYILSQVEHQNFLLKEAEREYNSTIILDLKNNIKDYNDKLVLVGQFYKSQTYFSDALKIISDVAQPEGLRLTGLSLDGKKYFDQIEIKISGFSGTRNDLLLYQDNLLRQKRINSVYFLPESWINPSDINFSVTLNFKPNGN